MFSVPDLRRFIAAGLVVIMFRIINDLPTLHMKSASRVTERAPDGIPYGAGFGAGVRAHLFRRFAEKSNDPIDSLDMGGNEQMENEEDAGSGGVGGGDAGGSSVSGGDTYNPEGVDGATETDGGDGGGGGDGGEENEMFDSSRREVDDAAAERAAAHVREAAGRISIPTVPDDDEAEQAITAEHPCVVTANCLHWRDWIQMPQEVLLTHAQVRNIPRVLEENKEEDPLTTRQRFTVEVWDPRRRHNPKLPNKPMHVIPMESTFLHFLPPADLARKKHATCAVVGNAGTMLHTGLGPYIDAHEAVVRINYAPTRGFERDVGASASGPHTCAHTHTFLSFSPINTPAPRLSLPLSLTPSHPLTHQSRHACVITGTKTTYDLSNKENSGKLGDGTYQWRNSTLLLSEGHSSVVRKAAYRLLVPASLGRGDSRSGQVPRPVRFLSMSLVSMSRFTWFAIKVGLYRLNPADP
jgi:hypothetical protein